jgi:hypothetical protein
MKIVSPFHDYYDSIQAMGIDKTCVYIRKKEEISSKKYNDHRWWESKRPKLYFNKKSDDVSNHNFIIGFCDHIYPGVKVQKSIKDRFGNPQITASKIFYDKKSFDDFNEEKIERNKYLREVSHFEYDWEKEFGDIFLKYKVPLFIVIGDGHNEIIHLNGCLKEYEFQKVKDPYTAYQYIYQYISGVLGVGSNPMIEISDKDKSIKHGFDKWSF